MDHHLPYFYADDHIDPVSWDGWRAGFLPGIRVTEAYIEEGEVIPPGWGIAYREWDKAAAVIMPIPFNLIWRAIRRVKRWFKVPSVEKHYLSAYRHGWNAAERDYQRGFQWGYHQGFHEAVRQIREIVREEM